MNLGDYIGDTRTDSLPPGFLKSIKIKYRHEASHVFAGLKPWTNEQSIKQGENLVDKSLSTKDESSATSKEDGVESEEQNVPGFMSWRVPSRLLNQKYDKTPVNDNVKAKSASYISGRTAASTIRSLTSTSLKRNEKSAGKKNRKPKVENKSLSAKHSTRKKNSTINSAQNSSGSFNKDDKKQREENEINVKPANSVILKPITLKLDEKNESVVKAKEIVQSKTESRENSQDLRKQRAAVVAHEDAKTKKHLLLRSEENIQAKNPEFAKISKEKISDGELTVDDKAMSEDGNKKIRAKDDRGIDEERFSNRSLKYDPKELPKLKGLMSECPQNNEQKKNASLPMIKPGENRTSMKLRHTPERMEKILDWVGKSTGREREAAFHLLSAYSESTESKTQKKKERVRITLQALERKRIPDSINPLRMNKVVPNTAQMRFEQKAIGSHGSHVDNREKEGKKTWHHVAMYRHIDSSNNRSALFVQPSKPYQRHFSIHPEWGLHTPVKFTNAVTT